MKVPEPVHTWVRPPGPRCHPGGSSLHREAALLAELSEGLTFRVLPLVTGDPFSKLGA